MVEETGVHDEQALADFMVKEQAVREPLHRLQWKCYYFKDYSPTESVIVFKVHHALADGIALVLLYANLMDDVTVD